MSAILICCQGASPSPSTINSHPGVVVSGSNSRNGTSRIVHVAQLGFRSKRNGVTRGGASQCRDNVGGNVGCGGTWLGFSLAKN